MLPADAADFVGVIRKLAQGLGFDDLGVAAIDLADDEVHLLEWLAAGRHGELHYMERFGARRARPAEITPGTVRVISVRLDYWPESAAATAALLADGTRGYIS